MKLLCGNLLLYRIRFKAGSEVQVVRMWCAWCLGRLQFVGLCCVLCAVCCVLCAVCCVLCAVLRCAVLCCAVLCCAVLCCAVQCFYFILFIFMSRSKYLSKSECVPVSGDWLHTHEDSWRRQFFTPALWACGTTLQKSGGASVRSGAILRLTWLPLHLKGPSHP